MDTDVLIVGAGPTGMVLGLWLNRLGVSVRIVDRAAEAGTTSRALAVQARTLELYRQLDLADAVVAAAHVTPAVNLWARGRKAAHIQFDAIGRALTPYPFLLIYPQDEHERLLEQRLAAVGVSVERGTEVTGFRDLGDHIEATFRRAGGETELCRARFIAGCDGAHSVVREGIAPGFPGGTYRQMFYVADVEAAGACIDGELHVDLDEADFLAVFPLAGEGRARLIGTVRDERADKGRDLKFEDVSGRAIETMKLQVKRVNWFSTYRVHHRVAADFRAGQAFILGDAAHIHSPAGGQGMNTGLGDAINLAWKLAAVIQGRAPDGLLDSYEVERMAFARRLVASTDRAFSFATAEGRVADILRTRLFPLVISGAMSVEAVREFAFRTVSQITLNYREGPLSEGRAGHVHGGDRLPWAHDAAGDNFGSLTRMDWQVHVYGEAPADVSAWCSGAGVPLHVFSWKAAHEEAGLAKDGLYLLRPDSYVALADPYPSAAALRRYFEARGLRV